MSARHNLHELQRRAEQGPVVPGSNLYRTLRHIARAIAKKLSDDARPEQAESSNTGDSPTQAGGRPVR